MIMKLSSEVVKLMWDKGKISTSIGCMSTLESSLTWKDQLTLDSLSE